MDNDLIVLFLFADEGSKGVEISTSMPPPSQPLLVETEVVHTSVATTEGEIEEIVPVVLVEKATTEALSTAPAYLGEDEGAELPLHASSMGIEGDASGSLQVCGLSSLGMTNLAVNDSASGGIISSSIWMTDFAVKDGAREGTVGSSVPVMGTSETPFSGLQAVNTMALSVVSEPICPGSVGSGGSGRLPPRVLRLVEQVYFCLPLAYLFLFRNSFLSFLPSLYRFGLNVKRPH